MSQSRAGSFFESVLNTVLSYGIALLTQLVVFPLWDIKLSTAGHFQVAAAFAVASMIRIYVLRRVFNWRSG